MKILIGHRDHKPGGFCRTQSHEPLAFPRLAAPTSSELAAFIGITTHAAATLAVVAETPACFTLKPQHEDDLYITRPLELIADLAPGTLVRPRLTAQGKRLPNGALVPAFEWELEIVGPN